MPEILVSNCEIIIFCFETEALCILNKIQSDGSLPFLLEAKQPLYFQILQILGFILTLVM